MIAEIRQKVKNKEYVNWIEVSKFQYLSEDFMREFRNKIAWYQISTFQQLSEEFIREFQDRVIWRQILNFNNYLKNF